jgi:hypothetical protein
MPKPLYARALSEEERTRLKAGLGSGSAFTVRRSQILLMSSDDKAGVRLISQQLKISGQCVREALRAFEQEGLACLTEKSHRKHELGAKYTQEGLDASRCWCMNHRVSTVIPTASGR